MRLDCSKTLDYFLGQQKMCEAMSDGCKPCPLHGIGCGADNITQNHIDAVQKWNDEHREKTNAEVLMELFPVANVYDICPSGFLRHPQPCNPADCYLCKDGFWNMPYKKSEVCE